jgi:invasion protein IalB
MHAGLASGLTRWAACKLANRIMTSTLVAGIAAAAFAQTPRAQPKAGEPPPPQFSYSPWTKLCFSAPQAQLTCFTGMDAEVESGLQAVAAVLIEREGETRKLLRIILPLGVQLSPGTRVIVDQNQPRTAPYVICFANGCMADYEASEELIGNMKMGRELQVQSINDQGQVMSLRLPLNDFGKAYDGPPSAPKALRGTAQ